jgi:hypothetical protein
VSGIFKDNLGRETILGVEDELLIVAQVSGFRTDRIFVPASEASALCRAIMEAATGIPASEQNQRVEQSGISGELPTPDLAPLREAWQPIETAPRDGSVIDLWSDCHGRLADCRWRKHAVLYADDEPTFAWFKRNGGRAFNVGLDADFSHWRPLPKSPAAEACGLLTEAKEPVETPMISLSSRQPNPDLERLVEQAKRHVMTPDEVRAQKLSFIRAQTGQTDEQILKVLPELAPSEPEPKGKLEVAVEALDELSQSDCLSAWAEERVERARSALAAIRGGE